MATGTGLAWTGGTRLARIRTALPVAIGLVLFLAALEVLRVELHAVSWHELSGDIVATPWPQLALALALTAANYLVLAGYDVLAFEYIGRSVPLGPVVGVSMLAYAVAHNVGFSVLSGLGALPLLLTLGRDRRGTVAHRRQLLDHLLARAARARRPGAGDQPAAGTGRPAGPARSWCRAGCS
ncbi:MAG: hypothetical protein R2708_24065 [Vicinamibacterales bacterium]